MKPRNPSGIEYENTNDIHGDEILHPELRVRPSTMEEEMRRALFYVGKKGDIILPEGISKGSSAEQVKTAVAQEYDPAFYKQGIRSVKDLSGLIMQAYSKLLQYQAAWGFALEPQISIRLTRYGMAGSYNPRTQEIIIRIDEYGRTGHDDVVRDVMHEAIHLALEHLVDRYNIPQSDKENLIDIVSAVMYPEIFHNVASEIDPESLTKYQENLVFLPKILEETYKIH